jgi:hypothetical protein
MAVILTNPANNPYVKQDSNGRDIQDSSDDLAFRGEYDGASNLIYQGFARPGAPTSSAVWQISKHTYDGSNNITSTIWPENANGNVTSEYYYVWDDRASYTYS